MPQSHENNQIHAMILCLCCLLWLCMFLQESPPALAKDRNRRLCTPSCRWPGRCGRQGPCGRSSCRRGTSSPPRCRWACPRAGTRKSRHRDPAKHKGTHKYIWYMMTNVSRENIQICCLKRTLKYWSKAPFSIYSVIIMACLTEGKREQC